MGNKPNIYGFCKAGCQWETVHKDEFKKSASHIPVYSDENGIFWVEKGKDHKVFADKDSSDQFTCSFIFVYTENGEQRSHTITHENVDKFADYIVLRFLEASINAEATVITIVYEIAGIRYMETISGTALTLLSENYIYISGATEVLLFNVDASIEADISKEELDKKLDKQYPSGQSVYTGTADGTTQMMLIGTNNPAPNTIPRRTSGGQIFTEIASAPKHAIPLGQAQETFANKLYQHNILINDNCFFSIISGRATALDTSLEALGYLAEYFVDNYGGNISGKFGALGVEINGSTVTQRLFTCLEPLPNNEGYELWYLGGVAGEITSLIDIPTEL